jgi:GT2 family glycosyltransferase
MSINQVDDSSVTNAVGVVIVNWNTAQALMTCVDSFAANGIQPGHLVVVDQGSTDGSVECLVRRHPEISIIVLPENRGYGHAVNQGFKRLNLPYVIISNADIVVLDNAIEQLLRVVDSDTAIALAGCRVLNPKGNRVTRFSRTSLVRSVLLELVPRRLRGLWRDAEHIAYSSKTPFDISYVEGAFMLVRREYIGRVGGFDEGFSFFFEDADLPIRLKKSGYRVIHVPTSEVIHVGGASFKQVPLRHAAEFYRNIVRLYERHCLRKAVWLRRMVTSVSWGKAFVMRMVTPFLFSQVQERVRSRIHRANAIAEAMKVPGRVSSQLDSNRGKPPLVSIIIPTCDRAECLLKLLQALEQQEYPNYEIIVVDQSTVVDPRIVQAYERFGRRLRPLYVKNVRRSNAKNIGIAEAKGDILLFCDDDIEPQKEFIRVHVESHKQPSVGGVSCRTLEEGLPYIRSKHICAVRFYGEMIPGYQSDTTCFVHTLVGGNMSVKREIQREVGYFDPMYAGTSIYEEQDFSERLRKLGFKILFTNATSVVHRPQLHGNNDVKATQPAQYYRTFHHNEIIYFLKNRSRWCLPMVIAFCFLRTLRQSVAFGLAPGESAFVFGGVVEGFRSYYRSLR